MRRKRKSMEDNGFHHIAKWWHRKMWRLLSKDTGIFQHDSGEGFWLRTEFGCESWRYTDWLRDSFECCEDVYEGLPSLISVNIVCTIWVNGWFETGMDITHQWIVWSTCCSFSLRLLDFTFSAIDSERGCGWVQNGNPRRRLIAMPQGLSIKEVHESRYMGVIAGVFRDRWMTHEEGRRYWC